MLISEALTKECHIFTFFKAHVRSIFITTEQTPNINSLKFFPGVDVLPKGSMEFPNRGSAVVSLSLFISLILVYFA